MPSTPSTVRAEEPTTATRRSFLRKCAAGAGAAAALAAQPRLAFATPGNPTAGDALVVIFLRFGADGLSLTPAIGTGYDSYLAARPTIAITPDQSLPLDSSNLNALFPQGLDGVIGLHPALQPLYDTVWADGQMAVLPACGMPDYESTSRSHFLAQDQMEWGATAVNAGSGLLARIESALPTAGPVATVSTAGNSVASLDGANYGFNVPNLNAFGLQQFNESSTAHAALSAMYAGTGQANIFGTATLNAISALEDVPNDSTTTYPSTTLGNDLRDVAAMLKSDVGLVSAIVNQSNWDDHSEQGVLSGKFFDRTTILAEALAAFIADLGADGMAETTIAVVSEFGRTMFENGNAGTDHGRGGTMFLIGGGVQGGVFGYDYLSTYENPGGTSRNALPVFTDYRQGLEEILATRMGVGGVFPSKTAAAAPLGVAKA